MTTWRAGALAATTVLLAFGSGVGCYKPNIEDGGLRCGDGGACPEGFHCSADGTCRKGAKMMCQASSPHMDAICPAEPGDDCDPICQSRCDCGRCNLVGTLLTCTPAGSKQTGDVCNVGMDDCSAGNICLKDCDGKTTRCYRFCSTTSAANEAVCGGQMCDVPVNDMNNNFTGIQVCDPPQRSCNPVGDSGDCGDPALGCYITSAGVTVCDCRGTAGANGDCGTYNSCITGYRCVSLMGATKCFKTCVFGGSDCTAPAVCKQAPGSPTYGYCDLP